MRLEGVLLVAVGCVLVVAGEDTPASTSVCEPGKQITKDCGVCTCNADGAGYSCAKECTDTEKLTQDASASEGKCTPGEVYKQGCNECKCPDSGVKSQAACTIIGCPEE